MIFDGNAQSPWVHALSYVRFFNKEMYAIRVMYIYNNYFQVLCLILIQCTNPLLDISYTVSHACLMRNLAVIHSLHVLASVQLRVLYLSRTLLTSII